MSQNRQVGGYGHELTNIAMVGLGALILIVGILRLSGSLAAWLTGSTPPRAGLAAGAGVLFQPGDPAGMLDAPGLNIFVYWTITGLLLASLTALGLWVWMLVRRFSERQARDPHKIVGIATRRDVTEQASDRALLKRAANLRPSIQQPTPQDVGFYLGASQGKPVWASVEDSILILGAPRSGKGLHLAINLILDAPGAVVTTSTRPDNVAATINARKREGRPVAVFDPQRLAAGIPAGLRWSPVRGCDDPLTAMIRAAGLASATGLSAGDVEGGGFWEAKTRVALQALLHAAALDGRSSAELFRWTLDPSAAAEAVAILDTHAGAASGWGDALGGVIDADPRTRDSIWQGVALSLSALADPRVLDAVSPGPDETFNPAVFLEERGTLYLLATGSGAGASASLVAALVEDIVEVARRKAAVSTGARLDPPLALVLDEIANISPLPSLPTLMAEGGGTGITTVPILQSLAQAREKWGDEAAGAIWDASIVKVILGGASNTRDLQDLSALLGERDEHTDAITMGAYGDRSSQRSIRRVPILPPERIRMIPFGTGITLLRAAPPIITELRAWTARTDAARLRADRASVEALLQGGGADGEA